ncbi:hypothetical protein [Shimia sp.]|uniref:hypothetical protein n=1 Tax=Shimia sp. TaxID=1954381 RepID=UPI003B8BF05D
MTSKSFIAFVLSAALIVTGVSAPRANAMDEDAIAALLFGVTALAVIGAAVSDNKKTSEPLPRPQPKPTKPKKPKKKSWLPSHCSKRFETPRGKIIQAYGQRCLHRAQYPAHRLPEKCYVRRNGVNGHKIAGYRTQCLSRNGYKVTFR